MSGLLRILSFFTTIGTSFSLVLAISNESPFPGFATSFFASNVSELLFRRLSASIIGIFFFSWPLPVINESRCIEASARFCVKTVSAFLFPVLSLLFVLINFRDLAVSAAGVLFLTGRSESLAEKRVSAVI